MWHSFGFVFHSLTYSKSRRNSSFSSPWRAFTICSSDSLFLLHQLQVRKGRDLISRKKSNGFHGWLFYLQRPAKSSKTLWGLRSSNANLIALVYSASNTAFSSSWPLKIASSCTTKWFKNDCRTKDQVQMTAPWKPDYYNLVNQWIDRPLSGIRLLYRKRLNHAIN